VDVQDLKRIDSAGAAARLLLVVAALAGFLLMHGLAATDPAGAHHLGGAVTGGGTHHDAGAMPAVAGIDATGPHAAPAPHQGSHDSVMAGCVFVLLALAGALVLSLWRIRSRPGGTARSAGTARGAVVARAPPCPLFVSLCVFRL
jgi:hypothetical protein